MKFSAETVKRWDALVQEYLAKQDRLPSDITTGGDAWTIAHLTGIIEEAYKDRTVVDAHIWTALKKIFPNAVFLDSYHY